jgi:CheY-like chemotaxis protein
MTLNIRQSVHAHPSIPVHLLKNPLDWRHTRVLDMALSLPRKRTELEMLTQTNERIHPIGRTHALRTVIVVGQPGQQVPESAFDTFEYDVVVLEPVTHAYSQVRRVKPALIVMCLSLDDLDCFQLLTMLRLDSETASIPIRMFVASEEKAPEEEVPTADVGETFVAVPLSMN